MTTGSSLSKSAILVGSAVILTAGIMSLYQILENSFSLLSILSLLLIAIPTALAFRFRSQKAKAEKERDNMRRMLEARAGEIGGLAPTGASESTDEIRNIEEICWRLAKGDFEARIIGIEEGSPYAGMKWAINELADRTDAFMRESAASMEHVADQKYYRRIIEKDMSGSFKRTAHVINKCTEMFARKATNFETVIEQFESKIGTVSTSISETSELLQNSANSMLDHANSTTDQVEKVSNAAVSASSSVQTVASSAEEMSASIQEIGRQVHHSLDNTNTASQMVESGNTKIKGLADAAQSIGEVVKLIEDIASQTNLPALNATIEAARAGDAGKGFAVVANEVKNLANQTAKATEDISSQIVDIQNATSEAVQSMETINTTVVDINRAVTAISSAMDEQNSATREIAQSVLSASDNTQSVSNNISSVQSSAEETSKTSSGLLSEANMLQEHSLGLQQNVADFLQQVRKVV